MAETTGARIKEARLAAGMTQKELAEAVDGLSAKAISEAERNLKELSDEQLAAIAEATGSKSLLGEAEVPAEESEALVIDDQEILELLSAAPPAAKSAVLSVLKGEDDPVSAITGVLGGILGGKKAPAKKPEAAADDDKEILELLKTAAPAVKEQVLSLLKG